MNILVAFADDGEFAPWRALRRFRRSEGNLAAADYLSEAAGAKIRVVLTGMGLAAAASRMAAALGAERPDVCISSGLAGGLRRQYRSGQVLVARAVRDERTDGLLACDEALVDSARWSGARAVPLFVSTGQLVQTAAGKTALGTAADAVEMESYAVLEQAAGAGVAAVAVRSVGDPVEFDLPVDFSRVIDARGRLCRSALLREVARMPHRIPALVRLGVVSRRAAGRLAVFLERYVNGLPVTGEPLRVEFKPRARAVPQGVLAG